VRSLVLDVARRLGVVRGVRCLVCGHESPEFVDAYVTHRPHVRCPVCESLERHRMLWALLQRRTDLLTAPTRLLYFAPETCIVDRLASYPSISTVTTDLYRQGVDVNADITDLPFEDGEFDAVICNHVLEHVPDDARAMRELRRVIKPTGWAVISVPRSPGRSETYEDPSIIDPDERTRLFGQHDHLRVYGSDFDAKLRAAGWSVSNVTAKQLGVASARYGIPRDYHLPLCRPI
jgi:SAM-dependent methyltransferase